MKTTDGKIIAITLDVKAMYQRAKAKSDVKMLKPDEAGKQVSFARRKPSVSTACPLIDRFPHGTMAARAVRRHSMIELSRRRRHSSYEVGWPCYWSRVARRPAPPPVRRTLATAATA